MPLVPVNKLKKTEIVWLSHHYCRHGHTYLDHFNCFLDECGKDWEPKRGVNMPMLNRIGFFDIETSHLKADFGVMLSYCIKDSQSDKIYERTIKKKEIISKILDKNVVEQCIEDLKKFDRIVTYYGTKFDIPFVRTRTMFHQARIRKGIYKGSLDKLKFPEYSELIHQDVYYMVRNKFNLSSNRLENACNIIIGGSDKTKIDKDHWLWATGGKKESLDYIVDHCRKDVTDLEKLYNAVTGFVMRSDRSI